MAKVKERNEIASIPTHGRFLTNDFPSLNQLLQKEDKKGLFRHSVVNIGYPTGFLPLDYRNGLMTNVYDKDDNVIQTYNNIGVFGGTFNTILGKTGTAKTTLASQMAVNISRYCMKRWGIPVEIYHLDAEKAFNYTRAKNINNIHIMDLKSIYHITRDVTYLDEIQEMMEDTALTKAENQSTFRINTGFLDEFGEPIVYYIPTIFILDSLPSLAIKSTKLQKKKGEAKEGSAKALADELAIIEDIGERKDDMYANRLAKGLSRFYKQMLGLISKYNFIVIAINHVNKKIETNGMPTSPQMMYLKMDEAVPCGFAPLYYAHNIFKIVKDELYLTEKGAPFDGFRARIEFLKSRSNKAGKFCELSYNQDTGFDARYSLLEFLGREKGLLEGRNPYTRIKGFDDVKFDTRNFEEEMKRADVYEAVMSTAQIALEDILSNVKFTDTSPDMNDISTIISNLERSQKGEF